MLAGLRRRWREFKNHPAGERFQRFHEEQKRAPPWVKPVMLVGAVVSLAIAIVLTVFPGPAFVFYGLTGALLAAQSARVAGVLDRGEVWARRMIDKARLKWRAARRRFATTP